ncbi:MAG: hypothetical protein QM669_05450 [Siphonobacter sp.]
MKRLLWFLGIVVLQITGWWAYHRWVSNSRSAWAYIPDDYLLAIESRELQQPSPLGRSYQVTFTDWPVLEEAQNTVAILQQVIPDTALLHAFLHGKNITYSLHAETVSLVNYVLYIPYQLEDQTFLNKLNSLNTNDIRGLKHQTKGRTITDVTIGATRQRFSFMQHDNYLILSRSSLLVENVAMKIGDLLNVRTGSPPTPEAYTQANTKLWINWPSLQNLGSRMMAKQSAASSLISLLPTNTAFRCQIDNLRKALLVETHSPIRQSNPYWQALAGQQPLDMMSQRMIPASTAAFYHFSLSDPIAWANRFLRYQKKYEPERAEQKNYWRNNYLVSPDSVYYHLNRELLLCRMESDELNEGGNLLLIRLNNPKKFINWIEYESGSIRNKEQQAKFEEFYSGKAIHQIALPELPSVWFGSIFQGFPKTFYTIVDGYAVLGSNVQVLRNFINDHKRGNVWANSAQAQELMKVIQPSPFTMVFNASKSWHSVISNIKNEWKGPVNRMEESLKRLNFLTWQTSIQTGNVNHRLTWTKGGATTDPGLVRKLFLQKNIPNPLGKPLQREPYIYRNPVMGTTDLIMQTQDNDLIPVPVGAKPTVKFRLSGPITSPIQLIDYFGRGRDQLLITTAQHLYVLDPTAKGYRLFASNAFSDLTSYQFIAFDQTPERKTQFSLLDPNGKCYEVTKSTLQLKPTGRVSGVIKAFTPATKLTIKGQEYTVLLESGGRLTLANAKGMIAPGFPVLLNQEFAGPAFVETSDREADFLLCLVTANGEVLKLNLQGKILERHQLLKPSKETRFRILLEESGKDWLIVQQTNDNVTLLDKRYSPLFNVFPITAESQLKFIDFGADTKIVAVTDAHGTMLYNLQGEKMIETLVPSQYPVTIEFAESYQKLFIYASSDRGVQIWTSKIR